MQAGKRTKGQSLLRDPRDRRLDDLLHFAKSPGAIGKGISPVGSEDVSILLGKDDWVVRLSLEAQWTRMP